MSATVVTRTLASTPKHLATATWETIVDLIAPNSSSPARAELSAVAGIACSCIADEALADDALVVFGVGPRLRIRCLYGDDAVEGDGVNDSALSFVATDGDWHMSIPCHDEDLEWTQRALAKKSQRVTARAVGTDVEADRSSTKAALSMVVNLEAFRRS